MLFVLSGAGNENFAGTQAWLSNLDNKIDALDFALCLDTIGSSEKLFLHVSRSAAKDAKAKSLYEVCAILLH